MKVSVEVLTYNHEKYISQALDSILMQKTDFAYEIVVGEDLSTDATRSIVLDYQKRYPGIIHVILSEENLGGKKNHFRTYPACKGQYIAVCEGDDYWTSPDKLQRQVDFLDSHPDCSICFHNVTVVTEDNPAETRVYCPADQKTISTLDDLIIKNFIPTCSVLLRNGLVTEFPDWFLPLAMSDWPFHILLARHGQIGYLKDVMAAYRIHPNGSWNQRGPIEQLKELTRVYIALDHYFGAPYRAKIKPGIYRTFDFFAARLSQQVHTLNQVKQQSGSFAEAYRDLPPPLRLSTKSWRKILGFFFASAGFANQKLENLALVRYCFLQAVWYDPTWLSNRGVWSLMIQSVLGKKMASFFR
jgi:glycosyltransferase involved in cell wall biosynthesis